MLAEHATPEELSVSVSEVRHRMPVNQYPLPVGVGAKLTIGSFECCPPRGAQRRRHGDAATGLTPYGTSELLQDSPLGLAVRQPIILGRNSKKTASSLPF